MSPRTRLLASASLSGLAAAAVVLVGLRLVVGPAEPAVDGEFVLDEPGIYAEPTAAPNPDVDASELRDVELTDVDGDTVRLDQYLGAPLVINVWFSSCDPCRRELPDFAEVHAELGDRVQFVGIDPMDDVETMLRFAQERGVTYDLLLDERQEFVDAAEIAFFPVTLFVDEAGVVVHQTGTIDADGLRSAIATHLLEG